MTEENQGQDYKALATRMLGNLEQHEAFRYADQLRRGEYGITGQEDSLYATLWGLRENVGLEGILSVLEAQGVANIEGGNGLNAEFSLAGVIGTSAKIFEESLLELKSQEIAKYIQDRVKVDVKLRYPEKALKEMLTEQASEKERTYASYLLGQVKNAVNAKCHPLVCGERAMRMNAAYLHKHPDSEKAA